MKVKEFVLYLFKVIPLFKWTIKEYYVPDTTEEQKNVEPTNETEDFNVNIEEVYNNVMSQIIPGYQEMIQEAKALEELEKMQNNQTNQGGNY